MKKNSYSMRALALLLSYPDEKIRSQMCAVMDVLNTEAILTKPRLTELNAFVSYLQQMDPLEAESRYVETFDRGRSTCLNLFEHIHGDSRDRGPAMIDLAQTYAQSGLNLDPDELPDHLCVVLEFASTQDPEIAHAFLGEMTHILNVIFSGLLKRESPYASVIAAVLEISGYKAQAVSIPAEASLEESWQEPEAFDGCSNLGQARPNQQHPIHFFKKNNDTKGVAA